MGIKFLKNANDAPAGKNIKRIKKAEKSIQAAEFELKSIVADQESSPELVSFAKKHLTSLAKSKTALLNSERMSWL